MASTTGAFAEYGTATLTHRTTRIALEREYSNPVAIAAANTANGAAWFAVEIVETGADFLDLRLEEGPSGDGWHVPERVSWLVVEAGSWTMADGTRIEAGTRIASDAGTPSTWTRNVTHDGMTGDPVMLHQVQDATPGWVRSRYEPNADPSEGGWIYTQGAETGVAAPDARVGWVAISDDAFTSTGDGSYLRAWHADQGTVGFSDVTDYTLENDGQAPAVFAAIDSIVDLAPVEAIVTDVQNDSFQRRIAEDPATGDGVNSGDGVSLLALGTAGNTLEGTSDSFSMGSVGWNIIRQAPSTLAKSESAVMFCEPLTAVGETVRILRLDQVDGDTVTVTQQDMPGYGAGAGSYYTNFSYLTVNQGRWQISDGRMMEVGQVEVGGGNLSQGVSIQFDLDFASPPALFLMIQTTNGRDWVIARHADLTADGATIYMQEAQGADGWHAREVVGWMAVETGSGDWDGFNFEVQTGISVDQADDGNDVAWPGSYHVATFAQLEDFRGGQDPVALSTQADGYGFEYGLHEDRSGDAEIGHLPEDISFMGIETPSWFDPATGRGTMSYGLTAEALLL